MLGAFAVGKTSLVQRFVSSVYDERYLTTVGVKVDKKELTLDGTELTLMLWDMAGKDAVTELRVSHLRGASGYILVADGTRDSTLNTAIEIHKTVNHSIGTLPFILAVNKRDLDSEWQVTRENLDEFKRRGWTVLLTSAKTGERVEELFQTIAGQILQQHSAD